VVGKAESAQQSADVTIWRIGSGTRSYHCVHGDIMNSAEKAVTADPGILWRRGDSGGAIQKTAALFFSLNMRLVQWSDFIWSKNNGMVVTYRISRCVRIHDRFNDHPKGAGNETS
jgi:hypothetical protein